MATAYFETPPPPETDVATRFRGHPLLTPEQLWPGCTTCGSAMEFQGQWATGPGELIALFQCQADPGGCAEWDADSGGNAALVVDGTAAALREPSASRDDRRGSVAVGYSAAWGVTAEPADSYDQAVGADRPFFAWADQVPEWLQGDETPACDRCAQPMEFVIQIEEGPWKAALNLGAGGTGYVFRCRCSAPPVAKWLWQCG